MIRASRKHRRAFTLVELLVVVTISAILLGVIGTLLVGLLKVSSGNVAAVARQQTLLRLAHIWREDVHNSRQDDIEIPTAVDQTHRVRFRQKAVEYQATGGEIVRTQFADENPIAREHFILREDETATFLLNEETGVATLRLEQGFAEDATSRSSNVLEFVAAIGLSLRYQEASP